MKRQFFKFLILAFITYSSLSPILYFWGLATGNGQYSDLRFRSKALYLISPMPLLFDKKDFFYSSSVTFTFENGSQEKVDVDKKFIEKVTGSSHRKLHFLRLLAFAEFYNSPEWQAAAKFMLCDPENMHISFTSQKKRIKEFTINNIYSISPDPEYRYIPVTCF